MRFGSLTAEKEVKVPPSEAWKLYGSLRLPQFIADQAIPGLINKFTVVQGDGAVGTVLELFFPGADGGVTSYKEKFTVIDDEKRVKKTEIVEGGYLDLGFTLYRITFEVIENEGKQNECITKSTIEYEVKDEFAENAFLFPYNSSLISCKLLPITCLKTITDYSFMQMQYQSL